MKNYLPRLLVTGGEGQLGLTLRMHSFANNFQLTSCKRQELDITDPASIERAIRQYSPDIIINTAAYTAVDKAEVDIETAMQINHLGAENLAIACNKNQIPLIHLSTDYVFAGNNVKPYTENDAIEPVNVYGKSKWLGEQAIREQCEQHIILRVSAVFSGYGNNFLKTMLRLAREREELNIVADQITCPTYAGNIASVIYTIAHQFKKFGTYHYCDAPSANWHQFAAAIIEEAKQYHDLAVKSIHAITTADYPVPAKRPAYSVLDCRKLAEDYGIAQAEWLPAISQICNEM